MPLHDPAPARDPARDRRAAPCGPPWPWRPGPRSPPACGSSDSEPTPAAASPADYDTAALAAGAGVAVRPGDRRASSTTTSTTSTTTASASTSRSRCTPWTTSRRPSQAISDQARRSTSATTPPRATARVTSAGSTAKAVVLAQAAGADPTSYGGKDLVRPARGHGGRPRADPTGRLQDVPRPAREASAADYANVVGQAYAVTGARRRRQRRGRSAPPDFLLAQQCKDGWFRLDFTKDTGASDQTCDGDPSSKPDLDATAFAVRALQRGRLGAGRGRACSAAVAWLEQQQASDGSFGGGSGVRHAQQQQHRPGGRGARRAGRDRRGREGRRLGLRAPGSPTAAGRTRPTWARSPTTTPPGRPRQKKGITVEDQRPVPARHRPGTARCCSGCRRDAATEGQPVGSC